MKCIYTGVFLTPKSSMDLFKWWDHYISPLHPKTFGHHMTINFRPTSTRILSTPIGDKVSLSVVGYIDMDGIQAVVINDKGLSDNDYPHITVATDNRPPGDSNKVLESHEYTKIAGPYLKGIVGFWDGKTEQYDITPLGDIYQTVY